MDQKIIFLKGLPASGKTTYALRFCKENDNYIRLNKDTIRELLGNPKWNEELEKQIVSIERKLGEVALDNGKSLIIDDTNFSEKHRYYWNFLSLVKHTEYEEIFFDVPLEECIRRDSQREKSVGSEVLLEMWKRHLEPKIDG